MTTAGEERGMKRALELAARGGKRTFPNPLVGAVVMRDDTILAEGFHSCCGGPHAEILALGVAGEAARGSALVVTLEPCCHTGRTGPCVREIITAGISRVVAAMEDPDSRVSGEGLQVLREAGIEVETGLLEEEARSLNRAYLHYQATGRSLLRLKMAVTLDGRIAASDGSSSWITGEAARAHVRSMRAESSAVLVGAGTVRADNPSLLPGPDCAPGEMPVRMVVTSSGHLDMGARLFDGTVPLVVALPAGTPSEVSGPLTRAGADVWEIPSAEGGMDLGFLLSLTAARGFGRILCEGGSILATSLLGADLVDEAAFFVAPALLGGEGIRITGKLGIGSIRQAIRLAGIRYTQLGDDMLVEGGVVHRTR
jgi:diaminohydroxyphosphoribosylaminopyrimidine deaminase/5-amino-6-(5-phosphoribosylamino)uracil reductase